MLKAINLNQIKQHIENQKLSKDNKIKVGFDCHGVIDKDFVYFSALTRALMNLGHEVHIITGHMLTYDFLLPIMKNKIKFSRIFSVSDFLINSGEEVKFTTENDPWFSNAIWDTTKADYCKFHEINIHFDDSLEYGKYFSTPYCHVELKRIEL